jgi:hypothetical protein
MNRPQSKRPGWLWPVLGGSLLLGLIVMALVAFGVYRAVESQRQVQALQGEFRGLVEQLGKIEQAAQREAFAPLVVDRPKPPPADADVVARATYRIRWVGAERTDSFNRYAGALDEIAWARVLEPADLRRKDARALLKRRIDTAREAHLARMRREAEISKAFIDDLRGLELPGDFKRGMEQALASNTHMDAFNALSKAELGVIEATEALGLALIEHRWEQRGDELLFYSDDGLYAYHNAQERLRRRIAEQEAVSRQTRAKLERQRALWE